MKARAGGRSGCLNIRATWQIPGIVGLILASGIPARAQSALQPSQSLMQRAIRVLDASDWEIPFYIWRGPHTVLTYPGDNKGDHVPIFVEVDTLTGRSQPFKPLNQAWRKYLATLGGGPLRLTYGYQLPDGRRLLLETGLIASTGMVGYRPGSRVLFAPIGRQNWVFQDIDSRWGRWWPDPIWTRDSRFCVYLSEHGVLIRDMVLGKTRRMPLSQCVPQSAIFPPDQNGEMWEVGINQHGRVLVVCTAGGHDEIPFSANLVDFELQASSSLPNVMRMRQLIHLDLQSLELSPDGTKLAWLFHHYQTGHFNDGSSTTWWTASDRADLWISRSDGKDLKQLGSINLVNNSDVLPDTIEWLPDGRHLSFVYKDALYTIPVD